jgi:hypothetical protein
MKMSLNFAIDKIQFEDDKTARFCKGTIYAFADGQNAHTHPIDTEVLMKCANTVYDIPVVCKYNPFVRDFLSHEEDETPIGFIKESSPTYSNPIVFEKNPDGRTFLVIKCLIWRRYAKDEIKALMNSNGKKSVSVEITITDGEEIDGKILVKEFVLEGITVLGDFVKPAVKDAHIQVEFAKDKEEYLNAVDFATTTNYSELATCEINTKKECVGECNMAETLDNSCVDFAKENPAKAEETAEQGMACEDAAVIEVNNAEQEMAEDDSAEKPEQDEEKPEDKPEEEEKMAEEEAPVVEEAQENVECAIENEAEVACADNEVACADTDVACAEAENVNCDCGNKEEMSIEQAMSEIATMSDRIEELEAQNKVYMSQIESMSDYEELKAFKFATEEKIKKDAEMAKMQSVMSEIESRGIAMSDSEKKELMDKFSEFNSAETWSNYVKAQIFDKYETSTGYTKIGLPFAEPKTKSIWDNI